MAKKLTGNSPVEQQSLSEVQQLWASANTLKIEIIRRFPFAEGSLYSVSIYDAQNVEHHNYVYVQDGNLRLCTNFDELAIAVGDTKSKKTTLTHILQNIERVEFVTGLIAVGIVSMVMYLTFRNSGVSDYKLPEVLSHALSLILGFYFGSAVGRIVRQ